MSDVDGEDKGVYSNWLSYVRHSKRMEVNYEKAQQAFDVIFGRKTIEKKKDRRRTNLFAIMPLMGAKRQQQQQQGETQTGGASNTFSAVIGAQKFSAKLKAAINKKGVAVTLNEESENEEDDEEE